MASSSFAYICVTNNPAMKKIAACASFADESSLDVLKRARALVHEGWELLSSPLYGNFKPNQQPYRTLLLRKNNDGPSSCDLQSLSLIEDAVHFFEGSHKIVLPGEREENIEKDFRFLDIVLMEDTFRQYDVAASPALSRREAADIQ